MEFSCTHCHKRYAFPDERVRGKRVRTKCRRCGGEILLDGTALSAAPEPSADPLRLEGEAAKAAEPPEAPEADEAERPEETVGTETPTAFGFDDGAKVLEEEDAAALRSLPPRAPAARKTSSQPPAPAKPIPRELAAIQSEPTRMVRLKKPEAGLSFWLVLVLALAAAAAGGFAATKWLEHAASSPSGGTP
jgi:hypothetical protein